MERINLEYDFANMVLSGERDLVFIGKEADIKFLAPGDKVALFVDLQNSTARRIALATIVAVYKVAELSVEGRSRNKRNEDRLVRLEGVKAC